MRRLEIIGRHQMAPVDSICYEHVDVVDAHIGTEGHIGVEQVVDVRRFRFFVGDDIAAHQVQARHKRNVPHTSAKKKKI